MALSHPSRVRELKPDTEYSAEGMNRSHPSRVRELKLQKLEQKICVLKVAPLPGA